MLAIAHRAGNSLPALQAALEVGADVFECDVHAYGGRLEVRHEKSLGPLPWLWEKWELIPASSLPKLQLKELLDALDGHEKPAQLMVDLKGPGTVGVHVAQLMHQRLPDLPVLVCSRWWPGVRPFYGQPWAHPVLSARNRAELQQLRLRLRRPAPPYGVSLHRSLLTRPLVAELHERVELVMTWPVNDPAALEEVLSRGVTGVISDEPDVLRLLRGEP